MTVKNTALHALPVVVIFLATLAFGIWATYAPPKTGEMAVVFAPGTSEKQALGAVLQAGGSFVSGSRFGNVIIVYAHDEAFRNRINELGGWFALSATGLCAPVAVVAS